LGGRSFGRKSAPVGTPSPNSMIRPFSPRLIWGIVSNSRRLCHLSTAGSSPVQPGMPNDCRFDCRRPPHWKTAGSRRILREWRQLSDAIAAPSSNALKQSSWSRKRVTRSARSAGLRWSRGGTAPMFPHSNLSNVRTERRHETPNALVRRSNLVSVPLKAINPGCSAGATLVHAAGFFFGLCCGRRAVDGVAFVPTFFGAFDARCVKREAHRCSKRL